MSVCRSFSSVQPRSVVGVRGVAGVSAAWAGIGLALIARVDQMVIGSAPTSDDVMPHRAHGGYQ